MNNIKDLHVEKELLPLFDFVYNEFSRDALIDLLTDIPTSIEEVFFRQQVLKALLNNPALYTPFSYYKTEFAEVYACLESLKTQPLRTSPTLHLVFAGASRDKEGARLGQLIIFLHKIDRAYFSHLDAGQFPTSFAEKIKHNQLFLADLDVSKYQAVIQKRSFNIPEIIKLNEFFQEKIRTGELDVFMKGLFLFEAYLSLSKGIRKHQFTFPLFNDGGLSIDGFYHPLLATPVKNSLNIQQTVVLLTGPNMSGKSTLLKAIGICVLLAHLGLAVPADSCRLPFFDVISISIDLNDDLRSGYSHFMTEIKFLKNVALDAAKGKKCFAVFDELFRGTNIEDALAISKTTISGLAGFHGSHFFISTHLHQLKETSSLNKNKVCTQYIECRLDDNKPVFTYKLQEGWSDLKIGQLLFEQEGLNQLLAVK